MTWVKWNSVFVTIDGTTYPIKDDSTNHKYVYWDRDFPYQFKTTQVLPEQTINRILVVVNNKGIAEIVPQKDLVINWDGQLQVDLSGVQNSINGLEQQITDLDGKVTTKFVGVETSLNAITNRVSVVEETSKETSEKVADLWIKSDEIGSKVEETITTLDGTNKDLNDFKNSVNQEFTELATELGEFNDYVNNAFKDNVISESETILIKEHLVTLDREKLDVIKRADYLLENPAVIDPERALLIKSKDEYNTSHENLTDTINIIIADSKVTPSERTLIATVFAQYNLKLSNLKAAIQKITDIGVIDKIETAKSEVIQTTTEITSTISKKVDDLEGSIDEELSQIKQTSNSINIRVERVEKNYSTNETMKKAIADAKAEILEQVTDIENIVYAVEDYIDNAFKSKLLGETFINNLNDLKRDLGKEKTDIDDTVLKLANNTFLNSGVLQNLNSKKAIFDTCYAAIISEIDTIIADGIIKEEENISINLKIQEYNFSISELQKVINVAIDDISTNKMNNAIQNANTQIGEVNGALGDLSGYIDGAFKDEVLDDIERATLKEKIDTLTLEKKDIDEQVSQILLNENLSKGVSDKLKSTKELYDLAHANLVGHINELLEPVNPTNRQENLLEVYFNDYIDKLGLITKDIQISIEDITKQSVNKAKEDLIGQIGEVDIALNNLNNYMEESFKNGIITEAEKLTIGQHLNILSVEKKDVDQHYDRIVNNNAVDDNLRTQLITSKNAYDLAHGKLIETIEGILSDSHLDNTEREKFDTSYSLYGDKLKELNSLLQIALEKIPEYLIDVAKEELRNEISDVDKAITDLEESMNTTFKDGVVDEVEAIALGELIKTLDNEADDILGRYEELKKNSDLVAQESVRLDNTWSAYNVSHGKLKSKIQTISNNKVITPEDTIAIEQLLSDYRLKLKTLGSVFERCVDSIAKKKADDAKGEAINYTKSEISILENKISLKVEKEEVNTTVNNAVTGLKGELQTSINESRQATENLENFMNGAFKDGVVDETELRTIQESLSQLEREKANIEIQYKQIYYNKDLE